MRTSPLVACLALCSGLALAKDSAQKPLSETLQAWFQKAKSYVPSVVSDPVDAAAANVALHTVHNITASNWKSLLTTAPGGAEKPEEWLVVLSGGNKTCRGQCAPLETSWNRAVTTLAADRNAPRLGYVNCDNGQLLCTTWFAAPPTLWHITVPAVPGDKTDVRVINVNASAITPQSIVDVHSKNKWQEVTPLEGAFQPFDGILARTGLQVPLGYILFAFGLVPSWTMMLIVSFATRAMMSRRVGNTQQNQQTRQRLQPPLGGAPPADEI